MSFHIGPHLIETPLVLAPMAGTTDLPFRNLCRKMGAGLAVSEMVISDTRLWQSRKTSTRLAHTQDEAPVSVQIAGSDPDMMASAAADCVTRGAQIIDINMGCPAKKVCNKAAGSALLQDEPLVEQIVRSVVEAVDVPVTLKIRTGWDHDNRNALTIAAIAEDAGVQALTIHGRTRADAYRGKAEYDTIHQVCQQTSLPVIANGDITSPEQAQRVLDETGAAAVMVGRGAQGRPWIFRQIRHYLKTGELLPDPDHDEIYQVITQHIRAMHEFYGLKQGVRIARKHIGWYLKQFDDGEIWRRQIVPIDDDQQQLILLDQALDDLLEIPARVA